MIRGHLAERFLIVHGDRRLPNLQKLQENENPKDKEQDRDHTVVHEMTEVLQTRRVFSEHRTKQHRTAAVWDPMSAGGGTRPDVACNEPS